MHFALPQRKSSVRPPTYDIRPARRKLRPIHVVCYAFAFLTSVFLLLRLFGNTSIHLPARKAAGAGGSLSGKVVVVTVFDDKSDADIAAMVRSNREQYARQHGYSTYLPNANDYPVKHGPVSWAKVPALRHAMTIFPDAEYFFHLDTHTLIMDQSLRIEQHIMDKSRLEGMMITDVPIVPPDSVIKTFTGLKGDKVDLVITQDRDGLSERSFILRRGEWMKFFLDAWFDPLYRTYNFQRAERHALEHIVQWHGTVLAKLALVPQNFMNSYHEKQAATATVNGIYKEGDFILNFGDCDQKERRCAGEMEPYYRKTLDSSSHPIV